ncbi:hypothetical protein BGZ58_005124 [Dissophora ornata]|nr:hypothetical protein BGZ58_005124 [Dissophora ornata]
MGRPASAHPTLNSNSCECQFSVPSGENSIHSVDPINNELSYISQPVPVDTSLFAPIRVACIRALNSETYCGREGSVFFGDGLNGYVLSYMFTVYDAQSRGNRVKYTIMTMMTDRVYLVASMEYLISQFQAIASNLQSMAYAISPQQQSPAARSLSYSSSHHRGSIMPDNAPTKRGRPLTDVLAKPDIFVQLHAAFVSEQKQEKQEQQSNGTNDTTVTVDSLRELRRVLGRKQFDKLVWNSAVGNQVIVRGQESKIVHEVIKALEDVLPMDCRTVIMDASSYEPSYQCNILGLDRSIPIPPDLDPNDFILLDICLGSCLDSCLDSFSHQQIPTPPASFPANPPQKMGSGTLSPIYQADWSSATLVVDMKDLSIKMEKSVVEEDTKKSSLNGEADKTLVAPVPSPPGGLLYSSPGGGFQAQRRTYLLQAGEEQPDELESNSGEMNGQDSIGRGAMSPLMQSCPLYMETINDILNYNLPRHIEAKRLAVLRDEWISKSIQFHNLYKAGKASNEAVVNGFLQTMRVDKRDLKILRFFTRCAKSITEKEYGHCQQDYRPKQD